MIRITTLFATCLLATSAFAADSENKSVATLSSQQGTVLVNQGEQFITASEAQALRAGDRVMVMEGGTAEITFADGCLLPLASGSLVDVPAISTCAGEVAAVQNIGPSYAQAVGAPRDDHRNRFAPWFFGAWMLGIGIALSDDGSLTPTVLPPPPPVSP